MIPDTASLWAGIRRFEDILKRDPQAYSFAPLVDLYLTLGLLEDALTVARKGCAIHPDFAAGQMALARVALECSLKDEAKSALEAVVRITPESIEAQRLLAGIYSADGDQVAAERCLGIVSSLVGILPEPALSPDSTSLAADDIADDDILELTDDLIEAEVDEDATLSPFSAEPERPSLGDIQPRAEPFLLDTAPPLYEQEQRAESKLPGEIDSAEIPAVVATATIAELYVSQGFPDRGADIYRELLQGEPDNEIWKKRLAELSTLAAGSEKPEMSATAKADAAATTESTEEVLDTLCGWLANIGRVRECRTKNL